MLEKKEELVSTNDTEVGDIAERAAGRWLGSVSKGTEKQAALKTRRWEDSKAHWIFTEFCESKSSKIMGAKTNGQDGR